MSDRNFQPKLPLELDENDKFININDILVNIKQKMRMVILTSPGEKLMNPNFGVGIYNFLFAQESGDIIFDKVNNTQTRIDLEEELRTKITEQVNTYIPELRLNDILVSIQEQRLTLQVIYSFGGVLQEQLDLVITE